MVRSRRRGIVLALAALALAAGPIAPAPAATTPRDPCAFARELLRAGILNDAATHFHAIAKTAQGSQKRGECAEDGLAAIRRIRRARAELIRTKATDGKSPELHPTIADRLADAATTGLFDEIPKVVAQGIARGDGTTGFKIALVLAAAHYPQVADRVATATLAAHPGASPPAELHDLMLAARARAAHQHLDAALALSRAGLHAESRSELEQALKADPAIRVPDELASPTRSKPFWNDWLGKWGSWIVTIAEIAAVALLTVAGVFLLLLILARGARRFTARVRIESFTGGPPDCREATAAAVRENFGRLNDDGGGGRAKFVSSSGEAFTAIPTSVAEKFPQAGWLVDLVTLLGALLPTRTRRVTAELRPRDPDRGAGMTITFGRLHGKVFDEETLWEADYGPLPKATTKDQVAYDSVALAAAAWLTFVSARHTLGRSLTRGWLPVVSRVVPACIPFPSARFRAFRVLGTEDWRSYALFASGADREQRYALFAGENDRLRSKQREIARQCYREALGRDPKNHGATFNLIGLELLKPQLTAKERTRVLERLADVGAQTGRRHNLWYRVRYLETVVQLRAPRAEPALALATAVDLCSRLLGDLFRLEHRICTLAFLCAAYRGRRRSARRKLLNDLRPAALILLAVTLKAADGSGAARDTLKDRELRRKLRAARRLSGGAIAAQLQRAPTITHSSLIAHARRFEPFMPNALYVLACYFTRLAGGDDDPLWDDAEHELRTAIERDPPLGRAALLDEALVRYRDTPDRGRRLEQLIVQLARA